MKTKIREKNEENDALNENERTIRMTYSALNRKVEKWLGVFVVSNEVTDDACIRKQCPDGLPNTLPRKRMH